MTENKKGPRLVVVLIVILAVIAVIAVAVIAINNNIISLGITVDKDWSEVKNQYQRQADLIPNLISTTKGYMQFEASLFTNLTAAQTQWQSALTQSEAQQDRAGVALSTTIGQFLLTFANYPELKSITAVQTLMDELAGAQNRIAVARTRYIDAIGAYNTAVQTFPGSLFGFSKREFYQGSVGNENTPIVTFP